MSVDRELWNEARPLFDELIELDSAERSVRLEEIGRSAPALKETLSSLLSADASADDPLGSYNFTSRDSKQSNVSPNARDPLGIIGRTVSHFRVTGFVAAGGMGVVYKGDDLQLSRTVALKFPSPHHEIAGDAKERFVREARAAALLDHPSLCSVYEIGDSDHGLFLAMPYYAGETLKDRLARERKPLPPTLAMDIARRVASGLASAHASGIIHRDLKPANIMLLPDGSVRILDFGLAKVRDISHTRSNARVGTVAYMAPEQIRGERVDARADLWALGVMLYQMLTGQLPFNGDHELTVLHAILHTGPKRASTFNSAVTTRVEELITSLLKKNREHRYVSAEALLADIDAAERGVALAHKVPLLSRIGRKRIGLMSLGGAVIAVVLALALIRSRSQASNQLAAASAPVRLQTLAVLPFVNREPKSTNEYLVSGFTDGIVSHLSTAKGLRIAGFFSASALQSQGLTPSAVGQRLEAGHVVEGSVRAAADSIYTSVRVRRVSDDSVMWSRDFSAPFAGIVSLEQLVADSIAGVLQVKPLRTALTAESPAIDADAYNLYLRARYEWEQRTRSKMEEALADYGRAIDRDPKFALAYSALAEAYVNMSNFGLIQRERALAVAEPASAKAVALDTLLAEAYATRGQVLSSRADYVGAERAFKRAIAVRPSAPWAHHYYALLLAMLGRFTEAKQETQRTLAIDPLSVPANATLGILMAQRGSIDEARANLSGALQLSPNFIVALYYLGSLEAAQGRYSQARSLLEQALAVAPDFPGVRGALANTYRHLGREAAAQRLMTEARRRMLDEESGADERMRVNYALDLALVGSLDTAFDMLRTAKWDIPTLFDLRADPLLQNFRTDPRYRDLLTRFNLKP